MPVANWPTPQRFWRTRPKPGAHPLLPTTLAELGLLAAGDPDTATLEQLAAGELIGTVAVDRDYVVNGDIADVVLGIEDGRVVRWTDVTVAPLTPLDPTRRLARITPGQHGRRARSRPG